MFFLLSPDIKLFVILVLIALCWVKFSLLYKSATILLLMFLISSHPCLDASISCDGFLLFAGFSVCVAEFLLVLIVFNYGCLSLLGSAFIGAVFSQFSNCTLLIPYGCVFELY